MTNISKTIVFFGSGPVAAASLQSLVEHFDIEVVITKAVPAHHKGEAPVETFAREKDLPLLFANSKNELDEVVRSQDFASHVGVIVDYGVIVSEAVINTFPLGIVNSHFSLLPEWRGADPITFSLLSGQPKTGVSLMVIRPTLDTGKLITQKVLAIAPDDTTPSLTAKLIDLSNQLLTDYLPRYISGEVTPKEQPHPDRATYSRKLTKADSILDFSKPAAQLEREIRAFTGWPKSRTTIFDIPVIVTKAHVSHTKDTALDLESGDGMYLSIDQLIGPSGRTMSTRDFLNGYAAGA